MSSVYHVISFTAFCSVSVKSWGEGLETRLSEGVSSKLVCVFTIGRGSVVSYHNTSESVNIVWWCVLSPFGTCSDESANESCGLTKGAGCRKW